MAVKRWLLLALGSACLACASARRTNGAFGLAAYPSAADYSGAGSGVAAFVGNQPSSELRAALESSAAGSGVTLQADARLGQAARWLADASPPVDPAAVPWIAELAARQFGVFDASIDAALLRVNNDPAAALIPLLTTKLASQSFTHYGVAVVVHGEQHWLSLVLSARRLTLDPVPRSVPVATPIRLHGQLPAGITQPRVELLRDGAARALLALGSNREFSVQLPTPRAGLYRVEIVGDTDAGSILLAKLPIYVGATPPRRLELPRQQPVYDFAAIRARVLSRINLERRRLGLAALIRDPRLDSAAQQHAVEMSEHAFMGHDSPRSADAKQRVNAAGLSAALVLETLARGSDLPGLEASAADGGGNDRSLRLREVSHVGVGVVAVPDAYGTTFLASELFAQLPTVVEPISAQPQLLSQVNQLRLKRGDAPLALDAGLSEVALRAARQFMADATLSERDAVESAQRELGRFSLAYRRVNALLTLTHDLDTAATLEPALDPRASGVGIAIAQGRRGEQGDVLAVVMIVGIRR